MPQWSPCWGCCVAASPPSPRRRGRYPRTSRLRPFRSMFPTWSYDRAGAGVRDMGVPAGDRAWPCASRGRSHFGPERSSPYLLTPLLPYGSNRVLGLDQRAGNRPDVISLRARLSRPDGSFEPPGHDCDLWSRRRGRPRLRCTIVALAAWSPGVVARPAHRAGRDPAPGTTVRQARDASRARAGAARRHRRRPRRVVRRLGARRCCRVAGQAGGPRLGPRAPDRPRGEGLERRSVPPSAAAGATWHGWPRASSPASCA